MNRCEDYPCCGHTDGLGCNWIAPTSYEHMLCDHNTGHCHEEEIDEDEHHLMVCGGCKWCDEEPDWCYACDDDVCHKDEERVGMTYNSSSGQWNEIPLL